MKKFLVYLATALAALLGGSHPAAVVNQPVADVQLGSATAPIAGTTYYLAGSGVAASDVAITLQSFTIPQTGYKLTTSDLSSNFYITLEPGNTKKQEIASCTTVVQNANNTATLSGCSRGRLPFGDYSASSSYAFPHGGGTAVIFSDPPQLFNEYPAKANNETVTGQWGFTQLPTSTTSTPTNQQQLITLYQFQQATSTGGINAAEAVKGVSQLATAAQAAAGTSAGSTGARLVLPASLATSTPSATISIPVTDSSGKLSNGFGGSANTLATLNTSTLVVQNPASATVTPAAGVIPISDASSTLDTWVTDYVQKYTTGQAITVGATPVAVYIQTDGNVYQTTSLTASTSIFSFIGFALPNQTIATSSLIKVQLGGRVNGFTGLTAGSNYYIADTAGTVSSTPGTVTYIIGQAVSTTTLQINKGIKTLSGTFQNGSGLATITTGFQPISISFFASLTSGGTPLISVGTWSRTLGNFCSEQSVNGRQPYAWSVAAGDRGIVTSTSATSFTVNQTGSNSDVVYVVQG